MKDPQTVSKDGGQWAETAQLNPGILMPQGSSQVPSSFWGQKKSFIHWLKMTPQMWAPRLGRSLRWMRPLLPESFTPSFSFTPKRKWPGKEPGKPQAITRAFFRDIFFCHFVLIQSNFDFLLKSPLRGLLFSCFSCQWEGTERLLHTGKQVSKTIKN